MERAPLLIRKRMGTWMVCAPRNVFGTGPVYVPLARLRSFKAAISYANYRISTEVEEPGA